MIAARLSTELTDPLASAAVAAAAAVVLVGVARAGRLGHNAAVRLAHAVALAAELLVAAGVLVLAGRDSLAALGAVAAIVAVRQVIARGVRLSVRSLSPAVVSSPPRRKE